jgi:hypothetical protein
MKDGRLEGMGSKVLGLKLLSAAVIKLVTVFAAVNF